MAETLQISIFERHKLMHTADIEGPVELGRQDRGEGGPYSQTMQRNVRRIVIAPINEDAVSRRQLALEPLSNKKLRISNLSKSQSVWLENGIEIRPDSAHESFVPATVIIGQRAVRIRETEQEQLQSLARSTPVVGNETVLASQAASLVGRVDANDEMLLWMQATMGVMQAAANSRDFYSKAAAAMIELVGLDSGRVLLLANGKWQVRAEHMRETNSPHPNPSPPRGEGTQEWAPSRNILSRLVQEKRTFWQVHSASAAVASLAEVSAVVVAPVLDRHGEVIGALYGDRRQGGAGGRSLGKLEAALVELLAGSVAAGLARVEQEEAALRNRVLFEQFFTAELSEELALNPDLLNIREAHISVLFCDVRGFSRISERIGPARTIEWISDTMDALSACVKAEQGVLVDYIGDELMAMWGAPKETPNHPALACRSALRMFECLPALNERWQSTLGEPIQIGVGVHTGDACVGNVGSRVRHKYGPLGNTNNVASRIQGTTKYFKSRLLISGDTRATLGADFCVRRLGKVRVVNVAKAVDIYELVQPGLPDWQRLQECYEDALARFEAKDFQGAVRALGDLMAQHPNDAPSLVLMSRAINCLVNAPTGFDPVWELPGK